MPIAKIGLDIAKHVFQVHGLDEEGHAVVRRQIRRHQVSPFFAGLSPCLVGIEACPGAHHWARRLRELGHEVWLLPPQYVKPYVKRHKNDAADAEAICEAVDRPTMRHVPVKTEEQQAVLMLHRTRELLIRQKVMLINAVRAQLNEFGVVAAQGRNGFSGLVKIIAGDVQADIPDLARDAMTLLLGQLEELMARIRAVEMKIVRWHRTNQVSRRLETIPGIGPITASVIAATVGDPVQFRSGRQFAAWLGLVPRQNSSGGKHRLGGSPSGATAISAGCSFSHRSPSSVMPATSRPPRAGWRSCWDAGRRKWPRSQWRTRRRGSSGPFCATSAATGMNRPSKPPPRNRSFQNVLVRVIVN